MSILEEFTVSIFGLKCVTLLERAVQNFSEKRNEQLQKYITQQLSHQHVACTKF